ncbi:LysM peptidoglycan-binding domain-containing protein [Carnobacterium funditum]|uniref:LysM peptidoglycan-binding domain-containing protein n=1 Tax=Carnobacterium funditum TaxID=2752 RepID=UPI0005552A5C|nr:LysM peptidoglycan-binding domain-containing protein [Carnobacterium funditum]
MEKTRKERIESITNKKMIEQLNLPQTVYKRSTAVLSTTLLIGLLAFPSFSVSATANDLANSSNNELEDAKEVTETTDKTTEEAEAGKKSTEVLSEDAIIEKEQRINELKLLLSEAQIKKLNFEELTIDEIEELWTEAVAVSNNESVLSEDSSKMENPNSTAEVGIEESTLTYESTAEDKVSENKEESLIVIAEGNVAEKVIAEKVATEKATVEKVAVEKAAAEKAAAEKVATEKAVAEKAAAEKATAEKVAAEKAAAEKATAEKVAVEKAAAEKATAEKVAAEKAAAEKAAADKANLAKIYIVKSGDTLNRIAKAHKISVTELKEWNKLSSNLIHPGDTLAVNKSGAKVANKSNEVINSNKGIEKMSNTEFINFIGAYAAEVAPKNNLYASVMVAQAALESGFGGSKLSSSPNYNLFGIKGSYQGQTVTMYTSEYSDKGGWIYIPQNFKKYPSHAESLQDNANLLKNGTNWDRGFYSGAWVNNAKTYSEATSWLQGRYATDPSYASKLNRLINDYNLTKFDKGYTVGDTSTKPTPSPTPEINKPDSTETDSTPTVSSSYQVKSGDSLWSIATSKNVSVVNIKTWNNLKADVIYVGQKLVIKETVTTPTPILESNKPDSTEADSTPTVSSSYQVKNGDTLWGIATSKNVSVVNIKTWNNLKADVIYVGQKLVIKETVTTPAPTLESNKPDSTETDSTPTVSSSYQVKNGDTLWGIATSKNVSVVNIKTWNNLKADVIYVGQKLVIKETVTTPAPTLESNKPDSTETDSTPTVSASYQIKSGDSLWSIATSKNVSVANIKTWNSLKSDVIYVGQKLVIKETVTTPAPTLESNKPDSTETDSTSTVSASYQIKSGDSLWSIATSKNVSVANIKTWNSLKSDVIYVGQKLVIKETVTTPAPTLESNKPDSTETDSTSTVSASYQIKSGDSLWSIATSKNVSVANIKTWNSLKSDVIYVGQKLVIKETVTTPAPTLESNKSDSTETDSTPTVSSSYQIKSGDSLWSIATSKNVSVANIKTWNNLKSDIIYVGQKLSIKESTPTVQENTPTGSNESTKPTVTTNYQVKSGDTLWGIANAQKLTIANLKSLNNLKSDAITVGQNLIVQSISASEPVKEKENLTKSYKVLPGDSLWAIANKLNTSVAKLKEWNYLKTDIIFVGQAILVK